jgi:hypothetical protein
MLHCTNIVDAIAQGVYVRCELGGSMNDKKNAAESSTSTNPFGLFAATWKQEAQQAMTHAMGQSERFFAEYEKGMAEMNKLAMVQMKMSQEAGRSMMDGFKMMMR